MGTDYPTVDAAKRQWKPARPTIHAGVQMRSRLEAGFARWCDEKGIAWQYEPFAISGTGGQYLPDFVLPRARYRGEGGRLFLSDAYVEVKPQGWWDEDKVRRMVGLVETQPRNLFGLLLATPIGFVEAELSDETVYLIPRQFRDSAFEVAEGPWRAEWWMA